MSKICLHLPKKTWEIRDDAYVPDGVTTLKMRSLYIVTLYLKDYHHRYRIIDSNII